MSSIQAFYVSAEQPARILSSNLSVRMERLMFEVFTIRTISQVLRGHSVLSFDGLAKMARTNSSSVL